jgi:hypothetical protein
MPVKHPFNIYREQLWPLYHGSALRKPNPVEGIYDHVSIGDVGYVYEGGFIRMFNVTLSWDDESNKTLGGRGATIDLDLPHRLAEPIISRMDAGVVEHFCLFPMGAFVKMSSTRKCFGNISETMWPDGSWFLWSKQQGLPIESIWNVSFWSMGAHW